MLCVLFVDSVDLISAKMRILVEDIGVLATLMNSGQVGR